MQIKLLQDGTKFGLRRGHSSPGGKRCSLLPQKKETNKKNPENSGTSRNTVKGGKNKITNSGRTLLTGRKKIARLARKQKAAKTP